MTNRNYRRTGETCPVCEDGELLQHEHERFCASCHTVIDSDTFPDSTDSLWERWWSHRTDEYDSFYGDERVRMVGGFTRPWFYGDDTIVNSG